MKTIPFCAAAWLSASLAIGQIVPVPGPPVKLEPGVPTVVESGPHHRVWQTLTVDQTGQTNVSGYTEVATALNFLNPATRRWEPSNPQFHITPRGHAVATNGQHQLIVAGNINAPGSVDCLTPDGLRLLSNPMGLSLFDHSTGRNLLIAEVTNSTGVLIAPNVILFDLCFDTIRGGLLVSNTREGYSQDVLLYEPVDLPADMNPATTFLEMYSEFHGAITPIKTPQRLYENLDDELLDFGDLRFGRGRAYLLGDQLEAVDVAKTWVTLSGRDFLVESVPFESVRPMFERLQASMPGREPKSTVARLEGRSRRELIAGLPRKERSSEVASIQPGRTRDLRGFLLDYSTLNTSQTNWTWRGDTCYYISGNVGLYGTNTTFEAGSVLKYTNNVSVTANTPITWLAADFRPIVMTSKDDNSISETISGSTGNPTTNYYANPALKITTGNTQLRNLRVAHAEVGVFFYDTSASSGNAVSHAQFVRCNKALQFNGYGTLFKNFAAHNVLMTNCQAAFYGYSFNGDIEHLTLNQCNRLADDYNGQTYGTTSSLALTNSILASVTNLYGARFSNIGGSYNGFYNSSTFGSSAVTAPSNPFQTVGAGSAYLVSGSNFRNAGTPAIYATLASELKKLTTYPPLMVANTISTPTVWGPQAQRDTDGQDLGYHYDPLDYFASNVVVSSSLALLNGVVVGCAGQYGLKLASGSTLVSEGTPINLNRLAWYSTAQESGLGPATSPGVWHYLVYLDSGAANSAQFRFTAFNTVDAYYYYAVGGGFGAQNFATLTFRDCQFGSAGLYCWSRANVDLQNCLFDRTFFWFKSDNVNDLTQYFTAQNCFFRFSPFHLYSAYKITDCLFDQPTFYSLYGRGAVIGSNNGYTSGSPLVPGATGGNDKTNLAANFLSGPLGPYYYPASGGTNTLAALLNAGSRGADQAGLYHYTTQINQAKETNSIVEIGFHYVPVEPSDDGLVARWRLDEGSGYIANDSGPYGQHGVLVNSPTWTTGTLGGALNFDGSNDQVTVNDSATLRISGDLTIAFWTKKNSEATLISRLIGKGNTSVRNYGIWEEAGTSKRLLFQQLDAGGNGINLWTTNTLTTGTWYHVAAVVQGNNAYFYINGAVDNSGTRNASAPATTDPLTFGYAGWNDYYPGVLDDIRIYNRALSATEIGWLAGKTWDSDGDGIPDYLEDSNGDGVQNGSDGTRDTDGDGVIDREDADRLNPKVGRLNVIIFQPGNGSSVN